MLHMAYATKIQGEDVLSECPKGNWPSSISHSIRWEWSPNTRLWMKSQHTADHRSDIRQILVWFQFFSLFFLKFAKYVTVRHLFAEHASILYNKVSFHTHSYFFSWSICSCSKSYYIHPLCVCVCVCVCVRLYCLFLLRGFTLPRPHGLGQLRPILLLYDDRIAASVKSMGQIWPTIRSVPCGLNFVFVYKDSFNFGCRLMMNVCICIMTNLADERDYRRWT